MAARNALDRADWRQRSAELRSLRPLSDGRRLLGMELAPAETDRTEAWIALRQLWLALPPHPAIIQAMHRGGGMTLILRYAAINWTYTPLRLDGAAAHQVAATWGAQLTSAYRQIVHEVPAARLGYFLRPLVKIDLFNRARVAFLPVAPQASSPPPDERAVACVIGRALEGLCADLTAAEPIRSIVGRCATGQLASLDELQAAWEPLAQPPARGDRMVAMEHAEDGVGWLAWGDARAALSAFQAALRLNPRLRVAREGCGRARDTIAGLWLHLPPRPMPEPRAWHEVVAPGRELEAERAFVEALALYGTVERDADHGADLDRALARCHLALGAAPQALSHAQRALSAAPDAASHALVTAAHLLTRAHAEALRTADAWLALEGGEARAHYARGRALFGLGRFAEARDAFDRASALGPQLIEAMLLRREADRMMRRVGEHVGTARPVEVDVPPQLAALRDALVTGRVHEALAELERPAYDDDAVATLVRAECLAFERRFGAAIAAYDRAAALAPEQRRRAAIGKVHALLALERAADALAELDRTCDADDVELVELRGLALQRLGLDEDAERELGRVVAASGDRSDLRLGRR